MNIYYYLLLLLIVFVGFTSCEVSYDIQDEYKPVVIFHSELKEGEGIIARISSSFDPQFKTDMSTEKDAICIMKLESGVELLLKYEEEKRGHWVDYHPVSGEKIELLVKSVNPDINEITSVATVPHSIKIINNKLSVVKKMNSTSGFYDVRIENDIDFEANDIDFIRFNARLEYKRIIEINDQDTILGSTRTIRYMDFEINASSKIITQLSSKFGVYADLTEQKNVNLVLLSSESIPDNYLITNIYCDITAITKSAYLYDIQRDKRLLAESSPYAQPIVDFSNISNGIGVFAASNMVHDTIIMR